MGIHPARLPASPQERVWTAIDDLRREMRQLRRAAGVGPQRGYASTDTGGTFADNTLHTLLSVDVNVPVDYALVAIYWRFTDLHVTGATTVDIRMTESTNFPSPGQYLGNTTGTTSPHAVYPTVLWDGGGTFTSMQPYPGLQIVGLPFSAVTAGDKTYNLAIQRSAGAGNIVAGRTEFWVVVL